MTNFRKIFRSPLPALAFLAAALSVTAFGKVDRDGSADLSLALLIQEDAQGAVASDIQAYRDFVRSLPAGTRVMVAYARVGALQVVQPFTPDLEAAAKAVRPPSGLANLAPGSPYESVKEVLKRFPEGSASRKRVVFVSDGFDRYSTLGGSPADNPILEQAIRRAEKERIEVSTIFAPASASVGVFRRAALDQGQGSLNVLADRTGGEAFFNGASYVSAKPFLEKILGKLAAETATIKTADNN